MKNAYLLAMLLVMTAGTHGAENKLVEYESKHEAHVEVAPGKFIEYKSYSRIWEFQHTSFTAVHTMKSEKPTFYQRDTTYLCIPWNKTELLWVGVGIPICIRSHKETLYMITFDRETDFHQIRFRFYKQEHKTFREIYAKDFPPAIATQNLWLRKQNGFRDGKPVNELDAALKLDPEDPTFQDSLTAKIWNQIETGKEYYEARSPMKPEFLQEFSKKHKVIKLETIEKKPQDPVADDVPESASEQ